MQRPAASRYGPEIPYGPGLASRAILWAAADLCCQLQLLGHSRRGAGGGAGPGRSPLDWKQCAPSGLVSQRFPSLQAACEAFEHAQVVWSNDLYLRRMGDQMQAHRSADDYKPTAMKQAEAQGAAVRRPPWGLPAPSGPVCGLVPRADGGGPGSLQGAEMPHPHRRRRSGSHLAER